MGIKIGDTREIELLDAIKNPSAINFKIGDKYAELTTNIGKTNGSPQLKFSKDGNGYYIREIFQVSGNFYGPSTMVSGTSYNVTNKFSFFTPTTKIKYLYCKFGSALSETLSVPETGDFTVLALKSGSNIRINLKRVGGNFYIINSAHTLTAPLYIKYTIE